MQSSSKASMMAYSSVVSTGVEWGGVTYLNPMIGYHGYYSYRSVMVAMVTLQVSNGCHGYVPQSYV